MAADKRGTVRLKPEDVSSTALAVRPERAPVRNLLDDVRLQKLWLAVERRRWQSLSVIAGSEAIETYPISELLAQLAWRYRGQPSNVMDLRDLSMRLVDYEVREMQSQVAAGQRLVVALRSIFENPTAAPIAQQTDAVLICIVLGQTSLKAVQETINAVGREPVIGSIVLRPRRARKTSRRR
jgi:hypothetical protein